jgi:hypothetical protein
MPRALDSSQFTGPGADKMMQFFIQEIKVINDLGSFRHAEMAYAGDRRIHGKEK